MKRDILKIRNPLKDTFVNIDGNILVPIKDKTTGHTYYQYETEKPTVQLNITNFNEINTRHGILWQLLFFIISIFGILDKKSPKCFITINYDATIDVYNDVNLTVYINTSYNAKFPIEMKTETFVDEHRNIMYIDQLAQKKVKFLKIIKVIIWILLIVLFTVIIINAI